ncbi:SSU ribosomal protein S2e (S5p) [Candidatus Nitrosotalea sp. TS]|jgi:small subunit ribosomal protein S5|uniref:30S ribosomal protein S5 n=1 Tax=Candidatus Nitrosotalea sp. TS TaxID=2341020 RepID=UPI001409A178|nr:30S ribosomal protein S5 [Candidatus Nitrosotalea sp. TS]MDE1826719.1 30S ribosomal protein S5 [Nitrososphaerota archaeon]MDE1873166.1 30S ribosomal protein S5 [Nitrososphaerota archaeon]NHI04432.1 SSU ribosomal protein S2e (S5p) [Candidatus Nitrosotalea sp. TS]
MSRSETRQRSREPEVEWVPRTTLGKLVATNKITSMKEIYENGYRIQESGIIKKLLPGIKTEVIDVGIVQKQTTNGEYTRFKALVAAGDENGWLGIGQGKSKQMRIAIEKATSQAYLNVSPVKLGCGSWECRCDQKHSVPFKVRGRGGSVTVEIIPGPRGLGLVAGGNIKNLLKLAGLKDAWTKSTGSTNTMTSTSRAVLNCLRQTFSQG